MHKFKPSDRVVRIQSDTANLEWEAICKDLGYNPYSNFTVSVHTLNNRVYLDELRSYAWDPSRFTLVAKGLAAQVAEIPTTSATSFSVVDKPQHYQFFPDLEAIEVIARSMTREQFYGYCLGNRLKYRLRAGNKDKLEQDIAKSDKYLELYEQHKGKCIAAQ
jgi:hypothetical protein